MRYPFGKPAAEEKVLSELRLRVTPKRLGMVEAGLGASLWFVGFVMSDSAKTSPMRWIRWLLMSLGGAGYIDALWRMPPPASRTQESTAGVEAK